ncbi:MAG: (2Fe-2S)-binding protein, partial [Bifidobacteriaceae bacterium]|nr:(2Fe-2S)-binding protein [Bifidobacteriaceae bacterium]
MSAPTTNGTVSLTIDGVEVAVEPGTLIIRAAERAGIAIPRFCDHPLLEPVGACRQCLVEVSSPGPDGALRAFPKPQAACSLPVAEGMVVGTALTSEAADRAQRGVMELLLVNHPLDCPVCDKGGECPLQNQAMASGRDSSRYIGPKRVYRKPVQLSAQILLDRERCILCQRCTRFASQIPGDPFIALQQRGLSQQIGAFDADLLGFAPAGADGPADLAGDAGLGADGRPFMSYYSGNVVQICPVGALTAASYRFRGRPFDLVSAPSVAEHDASASAIRVDCRRGEAARRLAGDDPEVNTEWITDKDRFAFRWQTAPDRLTIPLVRRDGELAAASWPEAIAAAAAGLRAAAGTAVLPGGRLTLEDALAYSVFARRVLKTDDVDYRARAHSAEEAAFLAHRVAGSGLGVTFADLAAAPAVLLVGFEPEEEGGIVFLRLRQAARAGAKIAAIAPLASPGVAKLGAQLIQTLPGGEAAALAALATSRTGAALTGGVFIAGERLAESPGAYTAALAAIRSTYGADSYFVGYFDITLEDASG